MTSLLYVQKPDKRGKLLQSILLFGDKRERCLHYFIDDPIHLVSMETVASTVRITYPFKPTQAEKMLADYAELKAPILIAFSPNAISEELICLFGIAQSVKQIRLGVGELLMDRFTMTVLQLLKPTDQASLDK